MSDKTFRWFAALWTAILAATLALNWVWWQLPSPLSEAQEEYVPMLGSLQALGVGISGLCTVVGVLSLERLPRNAVMGEPAGAGRLWGVWTLCAVVTTASLLPLFSLAPMWTAAGVFPLSLLVRACSRWAARAPEKPGVCRNCGYDLRASPERCPECGTPKRTMPGEVT